MCSSLGGVGGSDDAVGRVGGGVTEEEEGLEVGGKSNGFGAEGGDGGLGEEFEGGEEGG